MPTHPPSPPPGRGGSSGSRRLEDRLRDACRLRHFSLRTEEAYRLWSRRFILFHGKRHPREMGAPEITEFLTDLAVRHDVAPSTQMQALTAPRRGQPSRRLIPSFILSRTVPDISLAEKG